MQQSIFLCIALLLSLFALQAQGQAFSPVSLYHVQSSFIEGKALYVHGGTARITNISQQTFKLDLSTNWTTLQPAFTRFTEGFPSLGMTSAMLSDNRTWFLIYSNESVLFDTLTSTWVTPTNYTVLNTIGDYPSVTDPSTNSVYIVNGYVDAPATAASVPTMMRYDILSGEVKSMGAGSGFNTSNIGFAACWSRSRGSIIVFGGLLQSTYEQTMYEFVPSNLKFTKLSYAGTPPPGRHGHCMIEAYGGSKLVLFGGVGEGNNTLSDIYIFDVASLTWTAGQAGQQFVARAYGACAVTNDMFVAWGGATSIPGKSSYADLLSDLTVVYNMKTGEWQSTYSPTGTVTPPPPPPQPSGASSGGSSSLGALIGGIVGGVVVVVGAIVGLIFYRRRRRRQQKDKIKFSAGTALPVVTTKTTPSDSAKPVIAAKSASSDDPFEANAKEEPSSTNDRNSSATTVIVEAPTMSQRTTGDFVDNRYYTTFATPQSGVHPSPHAQDQALQQLYSPFSGVPSTISAFNTLSPSAGYPSARMSSVPEEGLYHPQQQGVRIFQPTTLIATPYHSTTGSIVHVSQPPHSTLGRPQSYDVDQGYSYDPHSHLQQQRVSSGYYPQPVLYGPAGSSPMTSPSSGGPATPAWRDSSLWKDASGRPMPTKGSPAMSNADEARASILYVPVSGGAGGARDGTDEGSPGSGRSDNHSKLALSPPPGNPHQSL